LPHLIGSRLPRVEDERLLRGNGRYVGDIRLPGMLFAFFVRATSAPAEVRNVSTEAARRMPGIVEIVTADVIPDLQRTMPLIFPSQDIEVRMPPILAHDRVRYAGEAVAIVIADSPYHAYDAAEAVEVKYELGTATVDPYDAQQAGAPLVHEDVPRNSAGSVSTGFGDIEAAFHDAPVVLSVNLRSARAACGAMEPRCVCVDPGPDDARQVTVFDSTQAPHGVRRGLASFLQTEEAFIRVVAPDVGGGFGPKGRLYQETVALAVVARHLRRPVIWRAGRKEDLLTTYQGRGTDFQAEIAAESDGRVRGLRVKLIQDLGAYAATGLIVPQNSAQHLLGPYKWPAVEFRIDAIYTHKVPLTPLRGGGRELGVWATERVLDRLADTLGIDPLDLREQNLIRKEEFPYDTGYPTRAGQGTVTFDSGDYESCLATCRDLIEYDRVKLEAGTVVEGKVRGVGVTLFLESTGMADETARAEVLPGGMIQLRVGSPSTGQGHATSMAQVFAERFGANLEQITYLSGDTAEVADGVGTFGSRMAIVAGNAAARAGRDLREKVLAVASDVIEAAPWDLELNDGVVRVKGMPGRSVSLAEIFEAAATKGERLAVDATYMAERGSSFAGGAHGAVVSVDIHTGFVTIDRYVVVHDCGTVINPLLVEGQVQGGVVHGLGNGLKEWAQYDEHGRLVTDSFLSYGMPLAGEMPRVETVHHESPSPYNPEGIKGAGEGGTIGALPTIAVAIEAALSPSGFTADMLPITREIVYRACAPLRAGEQDVPR
jgi:carbon-monoxide dehydrogenase large subunit